MRSARGPAQVALSLLLLLTIGACGSGNSQPPKPTAKAAIAGHDVRLTLKGGDATIHVPPVPSGIGVVVLHGFLESVKEPMEQGWSTSSDRHGFTTIYLDRSISWNAGLCCGDASVDKRDDVSWLVSAIDQIRTRFQLTTVYLAGNSNGAMMVERLVAERPDVSSRFALWASAPEMPTAGTWSGHGYLFARTDDPVVPRAGGTVVIGGLATRIRPAAATKTWLPDAQLTVTLIKGYGHGTPADWPELAWAALSKPQ